MNFRVPVLLLLLILPGITGAQGLRSATYNSTSEIQQKLEEINRSIQEMQAQMLALVDTSDLSPNTKFWLERAIEKNINTTTHQLESDLNLVRRLGKLKNLNLQNLYQIEQRLKAQQSQKDRLLSLFAEAESPAMESFSDQELNFYQISNGQKIAELGAGSLSFIQALSPKVSRAKFYVNEILGTLVQDFATSFQVVPFYKNSTSHFYAIQGSASSTYLEGYNLDAIIIRNAIHHFGDLSNMLRSIKASLHADGVLYLKEAFDGDCQKDCCPHLMEKAMLFQQLEAHGFQLQEQQILQETTTKWHLLAFRKREV